MRPEHAPTGYGGTGSGGTPVVALSRGLGYLLLSAEAATPEAVAFLVRYSSGIVHAAMTAERLDELAIPPMVPAGWRGPAVSAAVSVDVRRDTTTGISAADRATTLRALADPATRPEDLVRPGHVFPVRADAQGAVPVVATAALVDDAGELLDERASVAFAHRHHVPIVAP